MIGGPTVITARSELCKVLLLALSVTFLFVYEISREPLNEFAPRSYIGKTNYQEAPFFCRGAGRGKDMAWDRTVPYTSAAKY